MATIVMTGASSGFGAVAAERMVAQGARLISGARGPAEVGASIPVDLADLGSVREFAAAVRDRLDGAALDGLVLNAGLIRPDVDGRSADGFETTFAVNHLAHYLLARLLLPELADGATVVLTTSGTHDPATGAGLAPPRHADARLLAHPDRDPALDERPRKAGERAYTASKLCAVLTARSLSPFAPRATVLAYDPGQVFGTGLARDLALPLRTAWTILGVPVFGRALRTFSPTLNSRTAAGKTLADLALGNSRPPSGSRYAALRRDRLTWGEPSNLARDEAVGRALWSDSAELVGWRD
ncbi:SDR family NAD(P)-dependent oxidoreductase [Nocardia puris]|uniref:SDR family NAD(P)-dependent oxidoreductase n=1 Tax=Nocardia puris TaxID=208602 RepID=UPI002B4B0BAA|nr:SDR family NAD(P)-dependent oxidoreductase [Nocardia puris]